MQAVASLIFAIVPILLYLWAVWSLDRYDREPVGLLLLNFIWGAVGAVIFGIFASRYTAELFAAEAFERTVYIAPAIEEVAKGLFLIWTARDKRFDNITDGVVYGMTIGLGFGMTENFLYFLTARSADEWVQRVMLRTLYTAVMHAMATGVFGMAVGLSKYRYRPARAPLLAAGISAAVGIHMAWNYWTTQAGAGLSMMEGLFIGAGLLVILVVMQISLVMENRIILHELLGEAERGLIPQIHVQYLPYSSRRKILGWLPPSIDRRIYASLATRLAFRKWQHRYSAESLRGNIEKEIDELRFRIGELLRADADSPAGRLY